MSSLPNEQINESVSLKEAGEGHSQDPEDQAKTLSHMHVLLLMNRGFILT